MHNCRSDRITSAESPIITRFAFSHAALQRTRHHTEVLFRGPASACLSPRRRWTCVNHAGTFERSHWLSRSQIARTLRLRQRAANAWQLTAVGVPACAVAVPLRDSFPGFCRATRCVIGSVRATTSKISDCTRSLSSQAYKVNDRRDSHVRIG